MTLHFVSLRDLSLLFGFLVANNESDLLDVRSILSHVSFFEGFDNLPTVLNELGKLMSLHMREFSDFDETGIAHRVEIAAIFLLCNP